MHFNESTCNINMNAFQAFLDNHELVYLPEVDYSMEAQIFRGYHKALGTMFDWTQDDAVARETAKGIKVATFANAPLPKAVAPRVAPQGTVAASGNLIARIEYALVADFMFAQIQACLRVKDIEGGMLPTVELDPEKLLSHSRRGFKNVGPYIEVTVEATSKVGQIKAHEIMGDGLIISGLKGKYAGVRWVMSGVEDRKGKITILMTPGAALKDFWKVAGYRCKGNPKTILKRLRRSMTDGKYEFLGELVSAVKSVFYFEGGDGVIHEHPCKDAVYMIHTVIIDGISFKLNVPERFVAGHVAMNGSDTYKKILGIVDGMHLMAPSHINRLLSAANPKAPGYIPGDGVAITFDNEAGHVKGHGLMNYCGHRGMVIFDSKTEAMKIDGEVRLVIDRDLHRPAVARTDSQSINNFRYGQVGILSEFGKEYIRRRSDAIGDSAKLNALFEGVSAEVDYTDTLDAIEALKDPKGKVATGKSTWVLAANVELAKSSFYAVAPNGDAQHVTMNGNDGAKMDMWASPRMAKRAARHMMETVLQLKHGRVPIAADKAVRAYAMCDITIFSHPDKKYDGLGIFLSQGVLKGRQGLVYNVVLDENGMPSTRKEIVRTKDANGFYTQVEKSHIIHEMVVGPACAHRQPNGWAGEIERFLELVSNARYKGMGRSPFIFFSCDRLDVTGELGALLNNLIGVRLMASIVNLWGTMVPFIVILNNIVGGGDLDDLMMIYIYDKLVNFLRSKEELDFVASYPNEELVLEANVPVKAIAASSHLERMKAKRAAAASAPVAEFGRSDWFRILKLMKASGLVAQLSNTLMIWQERLNVGDPIAVNMGGYGRHLEAAIDAEMKTGEDVAGVAKRCDECNAAVVRVSKFLESRLPFTMRQEPTYQVVEGVIDRELAIIQADLDEFNAAFEAEYLNPNNVQIMDYMENFTPGIRAEEISNAWRKHYNDTRMAVKAEREEWLVGADFNTVNDDEKARFSIADSVKEGDRQSFDGIVKALWDTDRVMVYKAAVAMYQSMLTMKVTHRNPDGRLQDRPDALLYANNCNTVLREAMRYAKVCSLFPSTPVVAPQSDDTIHAAAQVGPALTVGNRMSKASEEAVAAFVGTAARHAQVILRYLDPKDARDMAELWTMVPVLQGKLQEAILVTRRDNQTLYGYVGRESFATWHLHAGGAKVLCGTLSRSANMKTGEINPFTVQVNLDLA